MSVMLGWVAFVLVMLSIPALVVLVLWVLHRNRQGVEKKPLEVFREMRNRGQISNEVYERLRREFTR